MRLSALESPHTNKNEKKIVKSPFADVCRFQKGRLSGAVTFSLVCGVSVLLQGLALRYLW